jgi:hypothetical protein
MTIICGWDLYGILYFGVGVLGCWNWILDLGHWDLGHRLLTSTGDYNCDLGCDHDHGSSRTWPLQYKTHFSIYHARIDGASGITIKRFFNYGWSGLVGFVVSSILGFIHWMDWDDLCRIVKTPSGSSRRENSASFTFGTSLSVLTTTFRWAYPRDDRTTTRSLSSRNARPCGPM